MERDTHRREEGWGAVPGTVFAMLFTAGVLVLGELGGSFGDPDRQFVSHHSDGSKRALDIADDDPLKGPIEPSRAGPTDAVLRSQSTHTGSTEVGSKLVEQSERQLLRVSTELGGGASLSAPARRPPHLATW